MPSGKTHDAVTFFLAVPVWILIWRVSGGAALASLGAVSFLFGGLMFGPDLDTKSVQYGRWGILKIFWWPYRKVFKHRSVWTHGLLFGALFRTIYFMGLLTIISVGAAFLWNYSWHGDAAIATNIGSTWNWLGDALRSTFGPFVLYTTFAGLWIGAASHSVADWVLSYIKTGRA